VTVCLDRNGQTFAEMLEVYQEREPFDAIKKQLHKYRSDTH